MQYRNMAVIRAALDAATDGILIVSTHNQVMDFNHQFIDLWKISPLAVHVGQSARQLNEILSDRTQSEKKHSRIIPLHKVYLQEHYSELNLKDGRIFEHYIKPLRVHEHLIGHIICFRDMTEQKKISEKLLHQATHDELTGLPNRKTLIEHLQLAIAYAKRTNLFLALLFLDIDHFKDINDRYGHYVGDLLLQEVAIRLQSYIRESDKVIRIGGDEFVIVVMPVHKEEDAIPVAQKIMRVFTEPFHCDGHELHITASIGISLYPMNGSTPEELIKSADRAMYRVKGRGRNSYQFFNAEMNAKIIERQDFELKLRKTLLTQEDLILFYQPIMDLNTNKIVSVEALLRWHHPDYGLLHPKRFLNIAEETGLITTIGEWVLSNACAQKALWQKLGLDSMNLAINLSSHQFRQHDLVAMISQILSNYKLPPESLELEFSESVLLEHGDRALQKIHHLRNLGIKSVIDDFGTGYFNLSDFNHLKIDKIKIERKIIAAIATETEEATVANAIISFAKNLHYCVVAEGIETEVQFKTLQNIGCNEGQGYYFCKPMNSEKCTEFLKAKIMSS